MWQAKMWASADELTTLHRFIKDPSQSWRGKILLRKFVDYSEKPYNVVPKAWPNCTFYYYSDAS